MKGSERRSPTRLVGLVVIAVVVTLCTRAGSILADDLALRLRATALGAGAATEPLTIELFRWSTDAEREPLLVALSTPSPAPLPAPTAAGRAGRGGRGGRGAAPPPSPLARLTSVVRATPTLGYIWGRGVTGYSIKYAWRSPTETGERIVLVIDRQLGVHVPEWAPGPDTATDAEFTLIELQIDGKGVGVGKTSRAATVVVEAAAKTLALGDYAAAPTLLKVTR